MWYYHLTLLLSFSLSQPLQLTLDLVQLEIDKDSLSQKICSYHIHTLHQSLYEYLDLALDVNGLLLEEIKIASTHQEH